MNKENIKVAVIASKFNREITDNLVEGSRIALKESGVKEENIKIFYVPGAFEIPSLMKKLCRENNDKKIYDGILAIGCVIKGETAHFEYISSAVSENINRIAYEYEIPTGFCVLTCYTDEQAESRCRLNPANADTNKGYDAAIAMLEMIEILK